MEKVSNAAALEIICGWKWEGWTGWADHSEFGPITRSLSEIVNELAFHWHGDSPNEVLSLLASGELVASGNYNWRAYRSRQALQHESSGPIPAAKWQFLLDTIAERLRAGWDECYSPVVQLEKLELGTTDRDDLAWRDNRFSTAFNAGDEDSWHPDYYEEWFSAWNIEIRPARLDTIALDALPALEQPTIELNKGGAPRQYDWERAVAAIVFKWADQGSWQPASKADVKNALADWFSEGGQHPSESLLKGRAKWLFEEFHLRNGEADNLAA